MSHHKASHTYIQTTFGESRHNRNINALLKYRHGYMVSLKHDGSKERAIYAVPNELAAKFIHRLKAYAGQGAEITIIDRP